VGRVRLHLQLCAVLADHGLCVVEAELVHEVGDKVVEVLRQAQQVSQKPSAGEERVTESESDGEREE
jgi:hypothetical protein